MTKRKMTMKSVKDYAKVTGRPIYKTGYLNLQNELEMVEPDGYTAGVYGWNCDVYIFYDFIVTTGYRPFGDNISLETLKNLVRKEK